MWILCGFASRDFGDHNGASDSIGGTFFSPLGRLAFLIGCCLSVSPYGNHSGKLRGEEHAMLKLLRLQAAAFALFASAALLPITLESTVAQSEQRYVQLVDYEIAPADLDKFIAALKEN